MVLYILDGMGGWVEIVKEMIIPLPFPFSFPFLFFVFHLRKLSVGPGQFDLIICISCSTRVSYPTLQSLP